MLTLTELHEVTGFDDIIVPFSEKLNDGKVYYRTVNGNYINLTGKEYREKMQFQSYLRTNLKHGLHLVDYSKQISFYRDNDDNYYQLKRGKLFPIKKKTYEQRIKWNKAKQKKRDVAD